MISSSNYLNSATLRKALPTTFLRRNDRDRRVGWDSQHIGRGFDEVRDVDYINGLYADVRQQDAALDDWFNEGYISTLTREDYARYPRGTLGGEFWCIRQAQIHDFEHLITSASFDYLEEIIPIFRTR